VGKVYDTDTRIYTSQNINLPRSVAASKLTTAQPPEKNRHTAYSSMLVAKLVIMARIYCKNVKSRKVRRLPNLNIHQLDVSGKVLTVLPRNLAMQ